MVPERGQPTTNTNGDWPEENIYDPQETELPPYFIDTPETREHRARYYSDITGMDEEFGKVIDLAREKLGDDVIYVFSSDHGGQWPFGKRNLYDHGIHVPLIGAWPGKIKPDTRTEAIVSWVDILPTLIDLTGGDVPRGIDGRSFAGVLKGDRSEHRSEIFTTHRGDGVYNVYPIRAIRTKRFKYILNLMPDHIHTNHSDILRKERAGAYWDSWDKVAASDPKAKAIIDSYFVRPAEELFDLDADRLEQNNLVADREHAATLGALRTRLRQWMKEQGDQGRYS